MTATAAAHEARHAAVGHLLGFKVAAATADGSAPRISFDHTANAEHWDELRLAEVFITAAAGMVDEPMWPPAWPPNPRSTDEAQLALIAQRLELNERQWDSLLAASAKTVRHPAVRAATRSIAGLLEQTSLSGRQIRDACDIAFAASFKELSEAHDRRERAGDPHLKAVRQEWNEATAHALRGDGPRSLRARAARVAAECGR